jgi:hypothetical protein
MSESFVFNSIHQFNAAKHSSRANKILKDTGVRLGILENPSDPLTPEERDRVLAYFKDFLAKQQLGHITIKSYHYTW